MTYLIPTKRKSAFDSFTLKISLGLFAVFFIVGALFFSSLSSFLLTTVSSIRNVIPVPAFISSYFVSRDVLVAENLSLKEKVSELISINSDRQVLLSENLRLEGILGRSELKSQKLGIVLNRPSFSLYDTLVIDIGRNNEVKILDKVYFNNLIIGEVVEVENNVSKVVLFSSPGKIFKAVVGEGRFEAEAKGVGGGGFEMLLPKGTVVKEGDPIVFNDISAKVFGFVSVVSTDPADAFQKVYFSLPVNIYEINEVLVAI